MVCAECNGKGYKIEKNGEMVCDECGGRGEYPSRESERLLTAGTQKVNPEK
jgi:DnaJ-class molecular chaperone